MHYKQQTSSRQAQKARRRDELDSFMEEKSSIAQDRNRLNEVREAFAQQ